MILLFIINRAFFLPHPSSAPKGVARGVLTQQSRDCLCAVGTGDIGTGTEVNPMIADCWLLIFDYGFFWLDWCPQADYFGEQLSINVEGLMMSENFMDYILSGYTLYENKGETWKYGQVLTKIHNIIVSL